ncbi:hypothetical protein [Sulfurovum mangrovi]|uniref:hypothetical protein n=1 Tax=Sulfurovum mangrovi TaxID=2893889 RepID=UPI001E640844|nr:hypothetical protein [Sulfurovum mangrovi]UFH60463.1 hypothetical protein LN246_06290 [Sulfurovum mangrovi]
MGGEIGLIFQYKYLYYIPAIYVVSVILRRLTDKTFYIGTWYPILIVFSFVIAGVITRPIKQFLEKKYNQPEKNSITYLLFFFAFWFFFMYDLPQIFHSMNREQTDINISIIQKKAYMSGGRNSYKKHYDFTVSSDNKTFDNTTMKALDDTKYAYLREKDKIILKGDISPFMFKLQDVDLVFSPLTEEENRHPPTPSIIYN